MEIQLQDLIEKIKKDGVEAAEAEADGILAAARAKAERIVAEAEEKARRLMSEAREESDRYQRVSEDAIRQAGRNLLISFRDSVNREAKAILMLEAEKAMSGENITELIVEAVSALASKPEAGELSVVLNPETLKAVESSLLMKLKEKMLGGVTLIPSDNFDGGFRISALGGKVYYDYSAAEVTDMLSAFLSPRVTALLKEAE